MIQKTVKIINLHGLHARPASDFVSEVGKYKSTIKIARADEPENSLNAKSIMNVLLMGLCKDDEAILDIDGPDEEEAMKNIVALIESGFGE